MGIAVPETLDDALSEVADRPGAQVLSGGTDFMVEVNFAQRRPTDVVALRRVAELRGFHRHNGSIELGAGLTYSRMQQPELADVVPALAQAARTVGSPQIRNAGTLGGNLGTGSPAGDTLPVLAALDASIEVASLRGRRTLKLDELILGPKRHSLEPDELIVGATVPAATGPQEFLKIGTRNAMVISVCSVAFVVDSEARSVRCALGAAGPVIIRATEAEEWIAQRVDWDKGRIDDPRLASEFGQRVAAVARPIDDHRSTAEYRKHAIGVLATRALERAL